MEPQPSTENLPELRFAKVSPKTWSALAMLKRTGWVDKGVQNPETVQEHTISLRTLAFCLTGLTDAEKDGLLDMLEIHDWPEAVHGDEVILTKNEEEKIF